MSKKVTVDFEGLSISIKAQCEVAAHSLCKIDQVLNHIHETADKLETSKVKEYEQHLLVSKKLIQTKIDSFIDTLSDYKALKKQTFSVHSGQFQQYERIVSNLKNKGEELTNIVNELTGSKLAVMDQMIDEALFNAGQQSFQALIDKANGVLSIDSNILDQINQIEDISLRELAYNELINEKNINLSYSEILAVANDKYDVLLGKKTTQVIEEYKEDLRSNGLSTEIIDKAKTIDEANVVVNAAITDEKVRKEALKAIIKAIKERGFIVDTQKNLKIDKEKNIVKLIALKASGQKAEFEIQQSGKFMYHFDKYEGKACQKDITPFLEDLKNIYDINILHEEVSWENPDKISTQKYQYINKNKGTN